MSTKNDIMAFGNAAECKANFLTGMAEFNTLFFICRGILTLIPYVNYFEWIWETLIVYNKAVIEAQYLCWKTQAPEEAEEAEISYEKFKNFEEYAENFGEIRFLGINPGMYIEAAIILFNTDIWQEWLTAIGVTLQ